ncbi:hypothetical protein [Cohnella hongkongensis]|uniref:Uncharacterized protein n=1 Tax=Cohnella hongkongensis TaxID=178337 RepID=A0ABV9FBD9_9BACL
MTMRQGKVVKAAQGLLAAILVAGIAFVPHGETARAAESQPFAAPTGAVARTAAPPVEPFGIFNPNHQYLDNGISSITPSAGKVTVSATTVANTTVDSVGVIFYVQKWNGNSWENVGAGATMGSNSTSFYHNTLTRSVEAGYYYRARTIHWVIHNGVQEQGEVITGSILGI